MTGVLIRRRKETQTQGEYHVTRAAEVGDVSTNEGRPGTASHHQRLGERREVASPSGSGKETILRTPGVSASSIRAGRAHISIALIRPLCGASSSSRMTLVRHLSLGGRQRLHSL